MSKKKHQRNPNNQDESSESGGEEQNVVECTHIGPAVNLSRVKKLVQSTGFLTDCKRCKNMPPSNDESDFMFEYDMSLWLCLQCGNQGCGRARNKHALQHFDTPHSDSHHMCVNTTTWSVWCYGCDDEVNVTCKWKLSEAVKNLKKQAESNKIKQRIIGPPRDHLHTQANQTLPLQDSTTTTDAVQSIQKNKMLAGLNLPRPRGLTNLGNTCFFNSVMQCLGQTPFLKQLLLETQNPGQRFILPGGTLKLNDREEIEIPPLEGEVEKWRPLTQTLAEALTELQSGRAEVFNPRFLLSKLTMRMPQFGGGDQHDAHELLRHLLEAVREDDQKRFYSVILEKEGLTSKTDPANVEEEKRKKIKFYGSQVSEMLLATEQVFRGVLVSTLQCQICSHVSHRDEFFLDLSLPICEKQVAPVLRRKAEEIEDNKPSKYQIKKEKKAERKKNKKHKNSKNNNSSNATITNAETTMGEENVMENNGEDDISMEHDNKSDSESDADVEDSAEDAVDARIIVEPTITAVLQDFSKFSHHESSPAENDAAKSETGNNAFWAPVKGNNSNNSHKGTESGYNSDKIDNSSPDSNNHRAGSPADLGIDDSGVPSPSTACLEVGPSVSPASPENSPASSETNVDMGSPLLGNNSPDEEYGEASSSSYQTRPMSRLAFTESNKSMDLKENLEKLILNDGDSSKVSSVIKEGEDTTPDGNSAIDELNEKMEDEDDNRCDSGAGEDIALYAGTLSPRYICEEGECSVESCLNQFTECELMMGANKVGCDLCTKRHGGPQKKTVYTEASKQLLIYNPPAVLILHLKRFQVHRFRSAKVSKFVKFSTQLDLAPFMSKRSQGLPVLYQGQNKVLYSLYGVVEHSGSIHGGHYVAYIKVRPQLDDQSPRWNFIPKNQKKNVPTKPETEPEPPPGRWFYISDSYVSEVTESKVLSAQAYLLFYERIM